MHIVMDAAKTVQNMFSLSPSLSHARARTHARTTSSKNYVLVSKDDRFHYENR
jgi:hypothetical protein